MPVYRKAPHKEALAFSFNDISMLLDQMSDKEKKYSLRARSSIRTVNGMQQTVYLLFLRNGSESVFEKWDNWWNAQAQRALAKQLVCRALAERPDGASPGQARMEMAHRERALLRARKIDRMAPERIRAIFSDCIAAQQEIDVFTNQLLAVSVEDRLKFDAFHQNFGDILSKEKPCEMSFKLTQKNPVKKNPINEMLAEADSHYLQIMLQAFLQFVDAVAENRPLSKIDLALVLEFFKKRKNYGRLLNTLIQPTLLFPMAKEWQHAGKPSIRCSSSATNTSVRHCRRRTTRSAASAWPSCPCNASRPRQSRPPGRSHRHYGCCQPICFSLFGPAAQDVQLARSMRHRH
jgi:hypothetical protein